jgi:hypothetical protein
MHSDPRREGARLRGRGRRRRPSPADCRDRGHPRRIGDSDVAPDRRGGAHPRVDQAASLPTTAREGENVSVTRRPSPVRRRYLELTSNQTDPVEPGGHPGGVIAQWHMDDIHATMADSAGSHDGALHNVNGQLQPVRQARAAGQ